MNAERAIAAESTVSLAGIVIGDLVGQGADRTLPRPRRILAVFAFYTILSLVASFGPGPARLAAAAGGVVALAALVLGATGRNIVGLIERTSGVLGSKPPTPVGAQPANWNPGTATTRSVNI